MCTPTLNIIAHLLRFVSGNLKTIHRAFDKYYGDVDIRFCTAL